MKLPRIIRRPRTGTVLAVLGAIVALGLAGAARATHRPGNHFVYRAHYHPAYWHVGARRVDLCQSLEPGMVGWTLSVGPVSVSRLSHFQFTNVVVSVSPATNVAAPGSVSASGR